MMVYSALAQCGPKPLRKGARVLRTAGYNSAKNHDINYNL